MKTMILTTLLALAGISQAAEKTVLIHQVDVEKNFPGLNFVNYDVDFSLFAHRNFKKVISSEANTFEANIELIATEDDSDTTNTTAINLYSPNFYFKSYSANTSEGDYILLVDGKEYICGSVRIQKYVGGLVKGKKTSMNTSECSFHIMMKQEKREKRDQIFRNRYQYTAITEVNVFATINE